MVQVCSGPKLAPNGDSFWVRRLFNVCVRFSVPQMLQFYLFTYPPRSKWASSEKMIFFARIGIFCKSIACPFPSVVQAHTQPYSFGGRIKLIICQIRHELSVNIHEISTSWKKVLDGVPYSIELEITEPRQHWWCLIFDFFFCVHVVHKTKDLGHILVL